MALLLLAATTRPAAAQSWDTSGNSLLKGTYYFREVLYVVGSDQYGDLSQAIAMYGNITFSGTGTYTLSCQVADSSLGMLTCLAWLQDYYGTSATTSGTYSISASGYGFLSNPLSPTDRVYGLVSQQGIFVGSSTESGFNDMFVAAPLASPAATNATFNGSYWIADMDFPNGTAALARQLHVSSEPRRRGQPGE